METYKPFPSPASLLKVLEEHIRATGEMMTAIEGSIRSHEQLLAATRTGHAAMVALRAELLARMLPSKES